MEIAKIPTLDFDVSVPTSRTQSTLLEPVTLAILIAIAIID